MKFEGDLRCIANYHGYEAQSRQCSEEMAELTKALNKYWRKQLDCGKKPFSQVPYGVQEEMDIIEEIADVQIMLWQMQIFHGVSDTTLREVMSDKIRRQLGRIEEELRMKERKKQNEIKRD